MADTVADLIAAFAKAGVALEGAQEDAVARAALKSKRLIEGQRDRVTGDGRLSGAGNARLGVSFNVRGGATPSAFVSATGPWQLIERDTKPAGSVTGKLGRITGRGARRARRQRDLNVAFGAVGALAGVKAMRTPYGPKSRINDKGTRGQHPFEKGVDRSVKPAAKEMQAAFSKAVARSF